MKTKKRKVITPKDRSPDKFDAYDVWLNGNYVGRVNIPYKGEKAFAFYRAKDLYPIRVGNHSYKEFEYRFMGSFERRDEFKDREDELDPLNFQMELLKSRPKKHPKSCKDLKELVFYGHLSSKEVQAAIELADAAKITRFSEDKTRRDSKPIYLIKRDFTVEWYPSLACFLSKNNTKETKIYGTFTRNSNHFFQLLEKMEFSESCYGIPLIGVSDFWKYCYYLLKTHGWEKLIIDRKQNKNVIFLNEEMTCFSRYTDLLEAAKLIGYTLPGLRGILSRNRRNILNELSLYFCRGVYAFYEYEGWKKDINSFRKRKGLAATGELHYCKKLTL